jgi:hypothetical protein
VAAADEPAEYALKVSDSGFSIERDLSKFDLHKAEILSFKVKADRDVVLRVVLAGKNERGAYEVKVKKSDKREKYDVHLDKPAASRAPKGASGAERTTGIIFEDASPAGASGALWLDTLVFRASFPISQRIKFELYKLIQTAVPMALAILALVVAAILFRIEEMGIIITWLREEGLTLIKEKLKGGKGRAAGPGSSPGPKGGPLPDVEA